MSFNEVKRLILIAFMRVFPKPIVLTLSQYVVFSSKQDLVVRQWPWRKPALTPNIYKHVEYAHVV